jgi:hypothetical protein
LLDSIKTRHFKLIPNWLSETASAEERNIIGNLAAQHGSTIRTPPIERRVYLLKNQMRRGTARQRPAGESIRR